ncbi:hypothetical protein ACJX0J_031246, partial [Zea mays]
MYEMIAEILKNGWTRECHVQNFQHNFWLNRAIDALKFEISKREAIRSSSHLGTKFALRKKQKDENVEEEAAKSFGELSAEEISCGHKPDALLFGGVDEDMLARAKRLTQLHNTVLFSWENIEFVNRNFEKSSRKFSVGNKALLDEVCFKCSLM